MSITLLTPAEAAEKLRVSHRQIHKMLHRGDLKGVQLGTAKGSAVRIDAASIDELLEAGRINAHS